MEKTRSFKKFAKTYGRYNLIQKMIISKYVDMLSPKIVDLGCGSEGLCKYRDFEFYLGIDNSEEMLKLNPCNTLKADFNKKECFDMIKRYDFNQLVSFSALQWAEDLEFVFNEIAELNKDYLLAIFTSSTFKTLHDYLQIHSPIYSKEEIIQKSSILNPKVTTLNYTLTFDTPKKLLEYIKYSGVGGGAKAKKANLKKFLKEFPFNYLEFEIVVLMGT